MRNALLLCFGLISLSASSQRYDISVGVDPIAAYNNNDSFGWYKDKSRQDFVQYYVKFGYVLDNDLELRLGYKFGINSSHTDYTIVNSSAVENYTERIMLHAIDASVLKIIKYKFINFMAGGTFYYGYQPAYINSEYYNGQLNGGHAIVNYIGPRFQSWGFYINTSLYFRIYKFLYAGMDITNGFLVYKWIGNATTTTSTYSSNGVLQSPPDRALDRWNELGVEKSLLNMDIGLRFFFDTKKSSKKKTEGQKLYF